MQQAVLYLSGYIKLTRCCVYGAKILNTKTSGYMNQAAQF